MTKKKNTHKPTHTLKNSRHATARSSKKKEEQIESNKEEEEGINEDIVVVVNQNKTMVRNTKRNVQMTDKVVGKVNYLEPNDLKEKKKTLQTTLSKQQKNGAKSKTSLIEDSESGTESNLDPPLFKKLPTQGSKAIINTKGCIDWELEQFVRSSIFLQYKFVTCNDKMNYSMEKKIESNYTQWY